jgi:hypothetical protein
MPVLYGYNDARFRSSVSPFRLPFICEASLTMPLVTPAEFARTVGVHRQSVYEAIRSGRLTALDGKLDTAVAKIQWEANRKRQPVRVEPEAPAGEAAEGSDYWGSKARREAAEAEIAELKAAELRGDLVRRALVERELAAKLVALRESLEVLAERLSAQVAAESDQAVCRRMLRDEHRNALAGFVVALEEVIDGVT